MDIANTPFGQLPPAWQRENLLAAEQAMGDIGDLTRGRPGVVDLEEASARTHVGWKGRNSWAEGEQAGPYSDLSSGEKYKDRVVVEGAVDSLAGQGHDVRAVNTGWAYQDGLEKNIKEAELELGKDEVNPDRKVELEGEIRTLRHKLDLYLVAVHMETPYGKHDKSREGTEGARPSRMGMGVGEEDHRGYLPGESTEEKQRRYSLGPLWAKLPVNVEDERGYLPGETREQKSIRKGEK